jgi:hypothetical protein
MKEDKSVIFNSNKQANRILIGVTLLAICFTLFTFLMAFNPDLLKENTFLTLQLVCAIPLFMTSLLSRTKASYTTNQPVWKHVGFFTFILAYAFLINVIGLFLISSISLIIGLIFFVTNIVLALGYSFIEVVYENFPVKERLIKDLTFILVLVLMGILPAISFY